MGLSLRSLWITLKQTNDGWITLCALNKLLQGQFSVHVLVHLSEDLVCSLLRSRLVLRHLHHRSHHFVDGGHNLKHLLSGDVAVAIEVVHGEGPLQFLLEFAARGHAERTEKLAKIDAAITVGIKSSKHMLGKLRRVSVREKVSVDFLKLLDGQLAIGTVLEEALVPLLDLGVCELGVRLEVVEDLGFEFAVLFPHVEVR